MGVHGLSTFMQRYHDKYKEKIYLHDCPVVVDGCNVMFFLYFYGERILSLGGSGASRRTNSSPLAKGSCIKQPYLFGGDYFTYAQNVRNFFQHLQLCNIIPIVLFDGAYDNIKISTAFKRFAESVQKNVKSTTSSIKGSVPGKAYSPIFMKIVFIEVLRELKVLHYQTEGEADCTIAFIARNLGNCPILSSDSDFHIYVEAVTLPLHTLKFKKVTPTKDKRKSFGKQLNSSSSSPLSNNNGKFWILHSEYVSLPRLCKEEFGLADMTMLPLAAVILGNDWISTSSFSKFSPKNITGGNKPMRKTRIASLLRWLGKQKCPERITKAMLMSVNGKRREEMGKLVQRVVMSYQGLNGETSVWNKVLNTKLVEKYVSDCSQQKSTSTSLDVLFEKLSIDSKAEECNVEDSLIIDSDDDHISDEENEVSLNDDSVCFEKEISLVNREGNWLPEWYLNSHNCCDFPTYLLKIARNKMVFLSPQVELKALPSSHHLCEKVISSTGGILLGKDVEIILLTRFKCQIKEQKIITSLPKLDAFELNTFNGTTLDFRNSLPKAEKVKFILEALELNTRAFLNFLEEWPASLKIWILCLVYFVKTARSYSYNLEKDEALLLVNNSAIPVMVAVFMTVTKNVLTNPSGCPVDPVSECSISSYLKAIGNDPDSCYKMRKFYTSFEEVVDTTSRQFSKSYDISKPYNLSRFTCVLFHVYQLNQLLGEPLKAPKISSNLNTWLIYNISQKLTCKSDSESLMDNVVTEVVELCKVGLVGDLIKFLLLQIF